MVETESRTDPRPCERANWPVLQRGSEAPRECETIFKTFLQPDHWSFTASSRNYRHPGNFQMQVDPVKQRAGQFRAILLDLLRRAGAIALVAGAVEAAGTSVKITP
jgi:hypothetical protein